MTMTLVATTTLTSSAGNITFSSIPQTATDLLLVLMARRSTANIVGTSEIALNGSTALITSRVLYGNGSLTYSDQFDATMTVSTGNNSTADTFSNLSVYIPNYTSSTYKSISVDAVTENNTSVGNQYLFSGLWSNTAAITSFRFDAGDTFLAGTTASLYTITKGSGGATVS